LAAENAELQRLLASADRRADAAEDERDRLFGELLDLEMARDPATL
jgi:hypothetical protein